MGFQVDANAGVRYREWAPNATAARLIGDFSEPPSLVTHLSLQINGRIPQIQ